MMKKYLTNIHFVIICLLISVQAVNAQNPPAVSSVRGKVIDQGDKQPIIGASVVLIDKDGRTIAGTVTDIEGNYVLKVNNPAARVSVSYLGYKSTPPVAANRSIVNFQLVSSSQQLEGVVITGRPKVSDGGGLVVDKRDATTSSFTVDAKDLEDMQSASIDQALQGRMPGVDIAATSGDPGAPMQIRIRGTSSLNGSNEPLIVVDGMPYEVSIPEDFNFATSDENNYGQLLNIAPADIKDITVLKDAAATALYGSRAANGVLVITTKRGVVGRPSISYSFKGSFNKQPRAIPTLNGDQYSTLIQEEFYNAGIPFSSFSMARQFQYDRNDPYNFYNYSNNTDWISTITQTAGMQNHDMAISGGGDKARYRVSVGYLNQHGTTKGTDYSRISSRINLNYEVSKRLEFITNFAYTHGDNAQLYTNSVRDVAYRKMPNQAVYEYDEFGNPTSNYFSPDFTAQGSYVEKNDRLTYNPLAMAETAQFRALSESIQPHFSLRYQVIPEGVLTTTGDVKIDINNYKSNSFLPQIATGRIQFGETAINASSDGDIDRFDINTKFNLIYAPKLNEKHWTQHLLSVQTFQGRNSGQALKASNSASSYLQDPSNPSKNNVTGSAAANSTESRSASLVLQSQYKFLDKYVVGATLRGDGSSRFGSDSRYGLFPAFSARWRISGERFMRRAKFIDDASLIGSWGQIGNAPRSDYSFYNTYTGYESSYLGQVGTYSTNIELNNLSWETKTASNITLYLAMFKHRLEFDLEAYKSRTTDMFFNDLQLPTYNGYKNVDLNAGTLDNQGMELSVRVNPVRKKNLRWDMAFNVAYNQNVIRSIHRLYPREKGNINENGVFRTYFQENNPFGAFYGYRYQGVYANQEATIAKDRNGNPIISPDGKNVYMKMGGISSPYTFQPGDAIYEDINFDGLIDYKDQVYLGNGNPKLTGGFSNTLSIKGQWRLSTNFTFRQGNDLINGSRMRTTSMNGFNNQSTEVLGRWRKENDQTDIPRALYGGGYNYLGSSRYVEDGSFIRLRSVTAGYDFSKAFATKLRMKSLKFYLTAENVFTLTNYTGQDPEVGVKLNGPFSVVVDNSLTPPTKSLLFGISTQF